ncbi:hypothetical protein ABZ746_38700 [Streptomyces sp. NPDC020096]
MTKSTTTGRPTDPKTGRTADRSPLRPGDPREAVGELTHQTRSHDAVLPGTRQAVGLAARDVAVAEDGCRDGDGIACPGEGRAVGVLFIGRRPG